LKVPWKEVSTGRGPDMYCKEILVMDYWIRVEIDQSPRPVAILQDVLTTLRVFEELSELERNEEDVNGHR